MADEAKRSADDGVRPIERVPIKIIRARRELHYLRICPFGRKARGEVRALSRKRFEGVCPKFGATGPKRESYQKALRRIWRSIAKPQLTICACTRSENN